MLETVYANGSWSYYVHPYQGLISVILLASIIISTITIEMVFVHHCLKGQSWFNVGAVVIVMNVLTAVVGLCLVIITVALTGITIWR